MTLTLSKAHHQFMPAIAAIWKSLDTYGHHPVQVAFTDNVWSDKAELENVLPALRHNVIPVPDVSSLKHLILPMKDVILLSSAFQVNTWLNSIMDSIPAGGELYVAMDMEWSVDQSNGIQGRVALISIALNSDIFLLPVCFCHFSLSMPLCPLCSSIHIGKQENSHQHC